MLLDEQDLAKDLRRVLRVGWVRSRGWQRDDKGDVASSAVVGQESGAPRHTCPFSYERAMVACEALL